MRPITKNSPEPLRPEDVRKLLVEHIPYRIELMLDGAMRVPAKTQQDNQAFEAGALAGRLLLSFLGVGFDRKNDKLRRDRRYDEADGFTDDVKISDVGGEFVEIDSLARSEAEVLSAFIKGVHKACAHLSINSGHQLDATTFRRAVAIILRLLDQALPLVEGGR